MIDKLTYYTSMYTYVKVKLHVIVNPIGVFQIIIRRPKYPLYGSFIHWFYIVYHRTLYYICAQSDFDESRTIEL